MFGHRLNIKKGCPVMYTIDFNDFVNLTYMCCSYVHLSGPSPLLTHPARLMHVWKLVHLCLRLLLWLCDKQFKRNKNEEVRLD